ncbi:hypothetical protein AGR6A_Lc90332 [Agrobacterium sp. NCPPB 925]|nr:hypothetical protein AGR6A_Lc90332 [Agrobacterium sp. NCPPB 925]
MFFLFVSEIVAKRSNTSRINTVRHVYKFKPDSSGTGPRMTSRNWLDLFPSSGHYTRFASSAR